MEEELEIEGLSDVDKVLLEEEFTKAGMSDQIAFHENDTTVAGCFEPLTATVIISGMALAVLALYICRHSRREIKLQVKDDGGNVIEVTQRTETNCEADVVAQLAKLFPKITIPRF